MKYHDIAQHYDKLFEADASARNWENWNGGEPAPLVKALDDFIASGDVLDIGAGVGNNSIYLSSRGFNVLATDISAVAVERIQRRANAKGVALRAAVCDIADEVLEHDFDAILCLCVLHHLCAEDALSVIKKMQQHTKSEGFNLITAFTKRGSFYETNPQTKNFYVDDDEYLKTLYSGWTIHISSEKTGPACQKGVKGETLANVFASILAQKR